MAQMSSSEAEYPVNGKQAWRGASDRDGATGQRLRIRCISNVGELDKRIICDGNMVACAS